ncbi:stage II sporulation protein P [Clostridium hydrogenum]|uniref:stage II sporulation protein P n=1 Tax=Clostridium hydrogenum TaxID=2855764 RepID=UPI001F18A602|nr:stage II sporulation protein P [Clostridium hydrogenum]
MNKKLICKNKVIVKISVLALLINLFIFMNSFKNVSLNASKNYDKTNMSYIQLMNYSIPSLKVVNYKEENTDENNYSLKNLLLQVIGIDIYHPKNVISKELACFRWDELEENLAYNNDTSNSVDNFDLKDIDISKIPSDSSNSSKSKNTVVNVYNPSLKKKLDESKPEVLIYHSHTFESYKPCKDDSSDPTQNVCAVGDELVKELEQNYGIATINDKTVNCADYNKSYTRSGELLDKYLKKYGDFKMIIDMHRDSTPCANDTTVELNGENVSKFMFVMPRKNPHYNKNMIIVNGLISITDKLFPKLCSGIYGCDYGINFYNQGKSNNAFLLEVGSNVNTLNEAEGSAKYIARVIAEYLNGKK